MLIGVRVHRSWKAKVSNAYEGLFGVLRGVGRNWRSGGVLVDGAA
jgi:hypothetical protein